MSRIRMSWTFHGAKSSLLSTDKGHIMSTYLEQAQATFHISLAAQYAIKALDCRLFGDSSAAW